MDIQQGDTPHESSFALIVGALTTGGILTLALAPLMIPIIVLTIVFVLPLLLIGAVAAIPIAAIVAVLSALGRLYRSVRERLSHRAAPGPRLGPPFPPRV